MKKTRLEKALASASTSRRNYIAIAMAAKCRSTRLHDRRKPRGGAKNSSREYANRPDEA